MERNNANPWLSISFFCTEKLLTITKGSENSIQFAITYHGLPGGAWPEPPIVELYLADVAGSRAHEIYAQPHPLSDFETL